MATSKSSANNVDRQLEKMRAKFIAGLPKRVVTAELLIEVSCGDSPSASQAVAKAYDAIHGICGLAGTLGYASVGDAARRVDRCLVRAVREKRGLEQSDMTVATSELQTLKELVAEISKSCILMFLTSANS